MPDETEGGVERIELLPATSLLGIKIPSIQAQVGIDELDGSIELGLCVAGDTKDAEKITPDADTPNDKMFCIPIGPVRLDIGFEADHAAGEAHVKGKVSVQDPILEQFHEVAEVDKCIYYSPAHGSVGGDTEPHPPRVKDPEYGESRMSSKNVTRIFVEDRKRLVADVGRVAKNELWRDEPDWVFNTVACVGPFDDRGLGSYSDPKSVWFNVFLGYYQIDAPKPDWDHPFGYRAAKGAKSEVNFEQVVRLGKSDWNYFSNWMYGVPVENTKKFDGVDLRGVKTSQRDEGTIGEAEWHLVKIGGVDFVSAYESDGPQAEKLVSNSPISFLWRNAFGKPNPRAEHRDSFIGASLDAEILMSYWEDDAAFHTVIFGGTAPTGSEPRFMAAQMKAAREQIKTHYPTLGFTPN